jgi:hypothetical protein
VIANTDGVQATGTVLIEVEGSLGQSQNLVNVENPGDASVVQFQGIPGRVYTIQYAESLQSPVWQTLGTSTADGAGMFSFIDSGASGSPGRVYRSTYP